MTLKRAVRPAVAILCPALLSVLVSSCGSDSGGFTGCTKDTDCKGDRLCVEGVCQTADAGGDPDAASGSGGATATGGATSASGGGTTGSGGDPADGGGAGGTANPDGGGGAPGDGGDAAAPPPSGGVGVGCGDQRCSVGERCCFSAGNGLPPPLGTPAAYTCAASCTGGLELNCDSQADCGRGETCCRVPGFGLPPLATPPQNRCEVDCGDVAIGCGGPEDCAAGQICCLETRSVLLSTEAVQTSCTETCDGSPRLCRVDADCPDGQGCGASTLLDGMRTCR